MSGHHKWADIKRKRTVRETKIQNAKIESTFLGVEDHGILSFFLHLDYGGICQGFGGYSLDSYDKETEGRKSTAASMELIRAILDTLEVESWEKLPGTFCRAKSDHSKVHAIGHPLKDKWLDIEEFFETRRSEGN